MKIVMFGEDLFTAAALRSILDNGHEVPAIICPVYPGIGEYGSLQKTARTAGIDFLHVKDVNADSIRSLLTGIAADLIVCVHLKKLLRKTIFTTAKKGAINVHPSLLPKYRGLSPQHQALLHGDTETGVTIHFIDEGIDTGNIIVRETIPLTMDTYIYDLQVKILSLYKKLIPRSLQLIEQDSYGIMEQDGSQASWYGLLKGHDRQIDLKKTKFEIYNQIRAVSKPYKGAFYNNITIWTAAMTDPASEEDLSKKYHQTGMYNIQDKLIIRAQDGILLSDDFDITQ